MTEILIPEDCVNIIIEKTYKIEHETKFKNTTDMILLLGYFFKCSNIILNYPFSLPEKNIYTIFSDKNKVNLMNILEHFNYSKTFNNRIEILEIKNDYTLHFVIRNYFRKLIKYVFICNIDTYSNNYNFTPCGRLNLTPNFDEYLLHIYRLGFMSDVSWRFVKMRLYDDCYLCSKNNIH